jgi:hypothetical protein
VPNPGLTGNSKVNANTELTLLGGRRSGGWSGPCKRVLRLQHYPYGVEWARARICLWNSAIEPGQSAGRSPSPRKRGPTMKHLGATPPGPCDLDQRDFRLESRPRNIQLLSKGGALAVRRRSVFAMMDSVMTRPAGMRCGKSRRIASNGASGRSLRPVLSLQTIKFEVRCSLLRLDLLASSNIFDWSTVDRGTHPQECRWFGGSVVAVEHRYIDALIHSHRRRPFDQWSANGLANSGHTRPRCFERANLTFGVQIAALGSCS